MLSLVRGGCFLKRRVLTQPQMFIAADVKPPCHSEDRGSGGMEEGEVPAVLVICPAFVEAFWSYSFH